MGWGKKDRNGNCTHRLMLAAAPVNAIAVKGGGAAPTEQTRPEGKGDIRPGWLVHTEDEPRAGSER